MSNRFSLQGKVALITGVGGNLGPVWARGILEAGGTAVGLDLSGARPSPAFEELRAGYGASRVALLEGDVRDRDALEAACARCLEAFGPPSILVNNAGIDSPPTPSKSFRVDEIPVDDFRRVIEVNTTGAFQATQVFGREMVKAGRGSVINIGSLYAAVSPDQRFYDHLPCDPPFLKAPAYGASKAALINLTKFFSTLWAPFGVRVNSLSPGGVRGGQDPDFQRKFCARVPMGRMAEFEDLIGPLVFLASDASSYVTGIELRVDGGFTVW